MTSKGFSGDARFFTPTTRRLKSSTSFAAMAIRTWRCIYIAQANEATKFAFVSDVDMLNVFFV